MEIASQMTLFQEETKEEKLIEQGLKRGSGFKGGKGRIKEMYRNLDKKERIQAIKDEYGTGGWSGPNMPNVDFNSKRLTIEDEEIKINLTWGQVEKLIEKMIIKGMYYEN